MALFTVWAPTAHHVRLEIGGDIHDLTARDAGWWSTDVNAEHGGDYAYLIDDDGTALPDPRSRWQPQGVQGQSRFYDDSQYEWSDRSWSGRQLAGSVLYELHIGTFTPEGTLPAAIERLDHLVDLGIDIVELMPVNAFAGERGWGFDAVCWYAVHSAYGGPDGLKQFVDACHGRGIGVLLDVVYSHLGPLGAYLARFGPYFTSRHVTALGPALNLDGPGSDAVRRHLLDNAVMWLRDYHLDGLRLDAVQALVDDRAVHVLEELSTEIDALSTHLGRPLSLVAGSDDNETRLVTARDAGGYGLTARWSDDFHHALHAVLTGEQQGYYSDFGSLGALAKTLTRAYFHDGTWSSFRGRRHGRPLNTATTPAHRFVSYLHNHDQVGNRAAGDRMSASLTPEMMKVGAALVLSAPFTPMLFMGEEWAAATPWRFLSEHTEWDEQAFLASKLSWDEIAEPAHADVLDFYRKAIALRQQRAELTDPRLDAVSVDFSEDSRWLVLSRGALRVVCNLAPRRQTVPLDGAPVGVLLASVPGFLYADGKVELDGESAVVVELA